MIKGSRRKLKIVIREREKKPNEQNEHDSCNMNKLTRSEIKVQGLEKKKNHVPF